MATSSGSMWRRHLATIQSLPCWQRCSLNGHAPFASRFSQVSQYCILCVPLKVGLWVLCAKCLAEKKGKFCCIVTSRRSPQQPSPNPPVLLHPCKFMMEWYIFSIFFSDKLMKSTRSWPTLGAIPSSTPINCSSPWWITMRGLMYSRLWVYCVHLAEKVVTVEPTYQKHW